MARIGVTGFGVGVLDLGIPYIRRAMDSVKIIRCLPEGVVHRAVMDSVSCNSIRRVNEAGHTDGYGTPSKRQISAPLLRSVRRACSPTQVTSQRPFCVIETGPPVYRGAMVRAFLKLRTTMIEFALRKNKENLRSLYYWSLVVRVHESYEQER